MNNIKDKIISKIKHLDLPPEDFIVIGSTCMVVKGLHVNHADIDILVNNSLWEDLKEKHPFSKENILVLGDDIECFKSWPGYIETEDADDLIREADIVDGIRFARLNDILNWKKKRKLEKDIKHIEAIENYLKNVTQETN